MIKAERFEQLKYAILWIQINYQIYNKFNKRIILNMI